jgi:formimidoylglutamate deiminase
MKEITMPAQIWAKTARTPQGWEHAVTIEIDAEGRIASVTTNTPRLVHAYDCVLPAPANAHSHAFQRAMAGLTERRGPDPTDSFWTWRALMYRFMDQLTPDQIEAITAFVQMEMLEAGYATNVEFHYLHHQTGGVPYDNLAELSDRVMAAAAQTGIGLTLLPVLYQYGGCDLRGLGHGQIRFGNTFDRYVRLCELAQTAIANGSDDWALGYAPHSLRAVARDDLHQLAAQATGAPIHMHLAEQIAEVDEVQTAWGARPVEWMLQNLDLSNQWHFIHCTQMQPHEVQGLARSGATAVLCPITESSLGDGIFDGVQWRAHDGAMAIGSDSNIRISLSEELRTLDYSQRLRDHSRAAFATTEQSTATVLLDQITAGGATAAGRKTGALAPGYWADMMAIGTDHPDLDGLTGDAILDAYVFAGDDRMVRDVWAAGRHMVQDGQHINRAAIVTAYRGAVKTLRGTL